MKIFYQMLSIAALVAVLVGCCNCRAVQKKNQKPLEGTEWQLVQLGGESIQPVEGKYTIQFFAEENRFAGVGECNHLTATYSTNEKRDLVLENAGMTRMMCPNQEAEDRFVEMLNKVTRYDMDGQMMMLFAENDLLAVFQAKQ
ncbi:MAG: META domain-containing protein [Alistipes sp.]|nr:META domain-containing protein [Rikenellaceae bacterium]MBO5351141.1 META domain-containing protein [Alistipes sp.]MBQ2843772.1 META domain-containing protein [Alistipes sp.]MBQ8652439.1 META domain-containing protein [Alistipes sp.]MBR3772874.1 META domain-containing protein [Alistipes sp.]